MVDDLAALAVSSEKVSMIPNGVDLKEFRAADSSQERLNTRAELHLPTDHPVVLFAGDIRSPRKNLAAAMRAIARLPLVRLAVVGRLDGSDAPALAERLGIRDRCHFLGFRDDMPRVMRACDAFVFPTFYEPFGIVVVEALASGLPVITTAEAGATDTLTTACGTSVADPADDRLLANAVSQWLDRVVSPKGRHAVAAAATAQAELFSWQRCATGYLGVLDRLLEASEMEKT